MKSKIYLASPFFNDLQIERVEQVRARLMSMNLEVYSPMHDCKFKLSSTPNLSEAKTVFDDNVTNILSADAVVAIVDDYDTGTLFELGLAQTSSTPIILVTFSDTTDPLDLHKIKSGISEKYMISIRYDQMTDIPKILNNQKPRRIKVLYCNEDNRMSKSDISLLESVDAIELVRTTNLDYVDLDYFDYVVLSRKNKTSTITPTVWGKCYYKSIPVIALGLESISNLMLQPSTTIGCDTWAEVVKFIISNTSKTRSDVILTHRGTGLLGLEKSI